MAEELDDIKSLWKQSKASMAAPHISMDLLEKYRPKTTLYWIRLILWIEFVLNLIIAPFMFTYLIDRGDSKWFIGFYVVLVLVYSVYYQFLIRSINRFTYDSNVVAGLKKVYRYLNFYLLHYKVVIWLSLIIGFVLGLLEGINDGLNGQPIPEEKQVTFWLLVVGISALFIGVAGGIFHFLIHLIYGKKIKRLKGVVKSLEKEES